LGPRPTPTSPTESNSEALDLRPLILAGAAWLGAGVGTSAAQGWLPWVMLAVAAMIAVVARSSRLVLASALVVCVTVSAGALRALVVADSAVAELAQQGAMVTITGQAAQGRRVDSSPGGAMWLVPVSAVSMAAVNPGGPERQCCSVPAVISSTRGAALRPAVRLQRRCDCRPATTLRLRRGPQRAHRPRWWPIRGRWISR